MHREETRNKTQEIQAIGRAYSLQISETRDPEAPEDDNGD